MTSLASSTNIDESPLHPLYLPEEITDETYNALIRQRPDLESIFRVQRKAQIERQQKNKENMYINNEEQEVLLVENEDNDITRPLREFEDERTTIEVNPALVPEFTRAEKQRLPFISHKRQRFNDTKRVELFVNNGWDRAWDNAWWAANCYTCYAEDEILDDNKNPKQNLCHKAFQTNDGRYAATQSFFKSGCYYSWEYRKRGYWKYRRYYWQGEDEASPGTHGSTLHRLGAYTKGCVKRFSDVSEIFTMRACRGLSAFVARAVYCLYMSFFYSTVSCQPIPPVSENAVPL
ncbi:hypothetical protein HW555_006233 [Spodoptera exigua]|uniref:Uncharacterized protein n=1 Tax=Spodoptera exigua TaxID=7107 RepID=A0A835GGF9_SPOEX|nr:hypothetical protein HW555_006233 [Spodoptera exigua]